MGRASLNGFRMHHSHHIFSFQHIRGILKAPRTVAGEESVKPNLRMENENQTKHPYYRPEKFDEHLICGFVLEYQQKWLIMSPISLIIQKHLW